MMASTFLFPNLDFIVPLKDLGIVTFLEHLLWFGWSTYKRDPLNNMAAVEGLKRWYSNQNILY